jgi:hypothetical protein
MNKVLIFLLLGALTGACNNGDRCEDIENKEARAQCIQQRNTPTEPTPVPVPVPRTYTVEYRVIGTAKRADITYVSTIYGSTDLTTGLPWFASFETNRSQVFVSLYALAEGN